MTDMSNFLLGLKTFKLDHQVDDEFGRGILAQMRPLDLLVIGAEEVRRINSEAVLNSSYILLFITYRFQWRFLWKSLPSIIPFLQRTINFFVEAFQSGHFAAILDFRVNVTTPL